MKDGLFPVVNLCFCVSRHKRLHNSLSVCGLTGPVVVFTLQRHHSPVCSSLMLMGNTRCSSSVFSFSSPKHTQEGKVHHRVARLQNVGWSRFLEKVQYVSVFSCVSLHGSCRRLLHDPSSSRRSARRRKCRGVQVSLWDQTFQDHRLISGII